MSMAAVLHGNGCERAVPTTGYGGLPACTSGRYHEHATVTRPGPGMIVDVFRTEVAGDVRFVVESTHPASAGELYILTAEQLS